MKHEMCHLPFTLYCLVLFLRAGVVLQDFPPLLIQWSAYFIVAWGYKCACISAVHVHFAILHHIINLSNIFIFTCIFQFNVMLKWIYSMLDLNMS